MLGDALRVRGTFGVVPPEGNMELRSVTGCSDGVCIDNVRMLGRAGRAGTFMSLPDEDEVRSNICSSPAGAAAIAGIN